MRNYVLIICCLLLGAVVCTAQAETKFIASAGPRLGLTVLSHRSVLDGRVNFKSDLGPVITQFGWQFEKKFYTAMDKSFSGVAEVIPLVGGIEQGLILPSVVCLFSARTPDGFEAGLGPTLGVGGVGLTLAGGLTFKAKDLEIPVSLALTQTRFGTSASILTGFNLGK